MIENIEDDKKYYLEMSGKDFRLFCFAMGMACAVMMKQGLEESAKQVMKIQERVREKRRLNFIYKLSTWRNK